MSPPPEVRSAAPSPPREVDEEPPGSAPAHWRFGTTADVGIGARAGSPEELFAELGKGLTDLVTDLSTVGARRTRRIEVRADSVEGLVVAYLTELIGLFDEEGFLTARPRVELRGDPPSSLLAELEGEELDVERHPIRVQVKAITLHRLEIDLGRGRARVIVDI